MGWLFFRIADSKRFYSIFLKLQQNRSNVLQRWKKERWVGEAKQPTRPWPGSPDREPPPSTYTVVIPWGGWDLRAPRGSQALMKCPCRAAIPWAFRCLVKGRAWAPP